MKAFVLPTGFTLKKDRKRKKYILFFKAGKAGIYPSNVNPKLIKKDAEDFLISGFPDEFPPYD